METITGPDGLTWTRSADRRELICENGAKVIGIPEMSTDYLLSVAYPQDLGPLVKVEVVQG